MVVPLSAPTQILPGQPARRECAKISEIAGETFLIRCGRAAAIYTLSIGMAKLNGVYPAAYSWFVVERIADYPIQRIADLPPWGADLRKPDQVRPAA